MGATFPGTLVYLLVVTSGPGASAAAIDRAVVETARAENLRVTEKKVILYGEQTNGPDTRQGKWACAKVVSLVLRRAGVKMNVERGVAGVERALGGWKKIADESDLRVGDVVVWTRRWKGNDDGRCTGGGTCHVGIYSSKGYFHNNPLSDRPTFDGIGLWGFKFKLAFRPPS
jgi:hypothetical protein